MRIARILDNLLILKYIEARKISIILVVMSTILMVISQISVRLLEHYAKLSCLKIRRRAIIKSFEMKLSDLERKDTIKLLRRIKSGERSNGGIETQLKNIYKYFAGCLKIMIALCFLIYLCISIGFEKKENLFLIIFVLVISCAMIFVLICNDRMAKEVGAMSNDMCIRNEQINAQGSYLFETIENEKNASYFKVFHLEHYFKNKLQDYFILGREYTSFGCIKGRKNGILAFLYYILSGVTYIFISILAIKGIISIGQVVMYASAVMSLFDGIQTMMRLKAGIAYKNQYLKKYEEFIGDENKNFYSGTIDLGEMNDWTLEIKDVYFKYPDTDDYIIRKFNLKINQGDRIALVGLNGSGKTTLVKLLCRLYEPNMGCIELNGIDISEYKYVEYLKFITSVFQDFQMLDFSIIENVTATSDFSLPKFQDVIEKVGMSNMLDKLPQKENTILNHQNKKGISMSGGELQKLAIARAIYKDSYFYILDEPTAALDPISEAEIYEKMSQLVDEKTVLYISHRMSSCKFCNRIVVLQNGEIIEQGTHSNLLDAKGLYYQMYTVQEKMYV